MKNLYLATFEVITVTTTTSTVVVEVEADSFGDAEELAEELADLGKGTITEVLVESDSNLVNIANKGLVPANVNSDISPAFLPGVERTDGSRYYAVAREPVLID